MKNLKSKVIALLKDESGQGMAEYALLIVVVLAVAMVFKNQLVSIVQAKMGSIATSVQGFNPGP